MSRDYHPNDDVCEEQFPRLWRAFTAAEACLKKIRSLRNKGRATDVDVENVRTAMDRLRTTINSGNWRQP